MATLACPFPGTQASWKHPHPSLLQLNELIDKQVTILSCIKTQPGVKLFPPHTTDVGLGMQALMGTCLSGNGAGVLGISLYQHRSLRLSAEFNASVFGVAKKQFSKNSPWFAQKHALKMKRMSSPVVNVAKWVL